MRSPRSSFHHWAVMRSGRRRSSSRAAATAADRTWYESQRGSSRTYTWSPRFPVVFGYPGDAELVEEGLRLRGRLAHVRELRARLRIQVEPELVGVRGVGREVRPHVEAEAAQVDGPGDVREVGGHERPRRRPVRRRDDRRLEPLRRRVGDALLEEGRAPGSRWEPLQEQRPAARRAHQRLGDAQVVANEVELRLAALGEEHLVGRGDPDLAAVDLEEFVARRSQPRRCYSPRLRPLPRLHR